MNTGPLFSIIIPVYNAEKYLSEAVCSVTNQSFEDFEVILVDDCSTDNSVLLAQKLCGTDSRLRLICMEKNGGAAAARNAGIRAAKGEYICFLDSDDTYEKDVLMRAKNAADDGPDVVLWGLAEEYYSGDGSLKRRVEILPDTKGGPCLFLDDINEVRRMVLTLEKKSLYGYLWNKAYRAELVEGLSIPKQSFNEDEMFNISLFERVKSLSLIAAAGTNYKIRGEGSLTHRELPDYYGIAMRRIAGLFKQQRDWGLLDDDARSDIAGQYVRYLASALERNTHKAAKMTGKDRRAFLKRVYCSDLYRELIDYANPQSRALGMIANALKKKRTYAALAAGRAAAFIKSRMTDIFYRAKDD